MPSNRVLLRTGRERRVRSAILPARRRARRWAPMKAIQIAITIWSGVVFAAGSEPASCPPGETVQWIADYCMATIGTDDEVAASDCISRESKIMFRSGCHANFYFKRALCEVVVKNASRSGTVDACVEDPQFVGPTVKNGGVSSHGESQ